MFNIGGNGQYLVGLYVANWIGISFVNMARPAHILLADRGAAAAGAVWAGIAGFLKATIGAHEVITTIMLNWIAYWIGSYVFQQGGPLQGAGEQAARHPDLRRRRPEREAARSSGATPELQGLHIGFFIAIAALVVFWLILNRTTLGYEVRAVGFNPDAAAYGGIKVRTNYIRAMAISGAFAGPRRRPRHARLPATTSGRSTSRQPSIGFLGIAVALLGRNTAVGVGLAALLFGAPRSTARRTGSSRARSTRASPAT